MLIDHESVFKLNNQSFIDQSQKPSKIGRQTQRKFCMCNIIENDKTIILFFHLYTPLKKAKFVHSANNHVPVSDSYPPSNHWSESEVRTPKGGIAHTGGERSGFY